jgi:hypothetical protein
VGRARRVPTALLRVAFGQRRWCGTALPPDCSMPAATPHASPCCCGPCSFLCLSSDCLGTKGRAVLCGVFGDTRCQGHYCILAHSFVSLIPTLSLVFLSLICFSRICSFCHSFIPLKSFRVLNLISCSALRHVAGWHLRIDGLARQRYSAEGSNARWMTFSDSTYRTRPIYWLFGKPSSKPLNPKHSEHEAPIVLYWPLAVLALLPGSGVWRFRFPWRRSATSNFIPTHPSTHPFIHSSTELAWNLARSQAHASGATSRVKMQGQKEEALTH